MLKSASDLVGGLLFVSIIFALVIWNWGDISYVATNIVPSVWVAFVVIVGAFISFLIVGFFFVVRELFKGSHKITRAATSAIGVSCGIFFMIVLIENMKTPIMKLLWEFIDFGFYFLIGFGIVLTINAIDQIASRLAVKRE